MLSKYRGIVYVAIVIGLIAIVCAVGIHFKDKGESTPEIGNTDETAVTDNKAVVADDASRAKDIKLEVENLLSQNPYLQLEVGEDDYVYLFMNSSGEGIAESTDGGVGVYRKDDKLVVLGQDRVIMNNDISPLKLIRYAAEVAGESEASDIEVEETTKNGNTTNKIYDININGTDDLIKVYDKVGDSEYAKQLVENLPDAENGNVRLQVVFRVGDNEEYGAYCIVASNDVEYTNWVFDGYTSMFDWSLNEEWYTYDINDTANWVLLYNNTLTTIMNRMDSYIEENNLRIVRVEEFAGSSDEEKVKHVENIRSKLERIDQSKGIVCTDEELLGKLEEYITEHSDDEGIMEADIVDLAIDILYDNNWVTES